MWWTQSVYGRQGVRDKVIVIIGGTPCNVGLIQSNSSIGAKAPHLNIEKPILNNLAGFGGLNYESIDFRWSRENGGSH
jgi:hypothetical protein